MSRERGSVDTHAGGAPLGAAIVGLIGLAFFINYVDRGNFATAAPLIKQALRLDNTEVGVLISSFFWVYAPGQLLAGWAAERWNVHRVFAAGLALWAIATVLAGFAAGFLGLLIPRLLLGLGESAAFPCSAKILAGGLPSRSLGGANGVAAVGLALGPAAGTWIGGWIIAGHGWRASFLVFGLLSLLWLVPWLALTRRRPASGTELVEVHAAARPPVRLAAVVRRRAAWAAGLGQFCANYAVFFIVSWLPLYLVRHRGFSIVQMADFLAVVYVIYAAAGFAFGRLSDTLIHRGRSVNGVRKTMVVAAHLGTAACLAICAGGGARATIAALLAVGIFLGMNTPNHLAIGQTLAGPSAAGTWMGFQNGLANVAGVIGPVLTGLAVDLTGDFAWAFAMTAGVTLAGAALWAWAAPPIAPLRWGEEAAA